MRQRLRCIVCGCVAWPTMLSRGELGLHPIEIMTLLGGLGKAKGINWGHEDVSRNPVFLRKWIQTLRAVFSRCRRLLTSLGEDVEGLEPLRVFRPLVVQRPDVVHLRPLVVYQPKVF